uniref:DNA mismatch repair protein n=3 Tax=Malacalcyonacea TaxID=3028843 RepID=G4V328_9CNID|nr:DNA mismatch repair protein [Calicogorgia granulosa]ACZ34429.1 DNA mismatch repair protein [Calicogorgia granulosa]
MNQIPTLYFNLAKGNNSKYGLSVIQLIQIGKFYELWHEPDTTCLQQAHSQAELLTKTHMKCRPLEATPPIEQVASLLDMRITSPGKRSLLQMGFPTFSLKTHLSTLLEKGWTVIVIDELITGKAGPKQRAVSQVYSPSCNLEDSSEITYVLSIYFSQGDLLGISLLSPMSGHSIMFPVSWPDRDKVARLLISYRIREIVIWANSGVELERFTNKVYNILIGWNLFPPEPNAKIEVMGEAVHKTPRYLSYRYENVNKEWLLLHIYIGIDAEWFNKNYQEYTLSKIFLTTWTENVKQEILISLLGVLQFIKDRNPNLIRNLDLPECYNSVVSPQSLILCNRAEYQLDLMPNRGKQGGLLSLINCCSTAMGKRLLKFRLLNPITDYKKLDNRYEEIASFKQLFDKDLFDKSELKHIKDLSSLHRHWAICASGDSTLPPEKFSQIYHSYLSASRLLRKLEPYKFIQLPPSIGDQLESLIKEIGRVFQVDRLTAEIKDILQPSNYLTDLCAQHHTLKTQLTEWAVQTSNIVFQDTNSIKAEFYNKEGYAFAILSRKLTKLEQYITSASISDKPIIVLAKKRNNVIITSPANQKVSVDLNSLEEQIKTCANQIYNQELRRLYFRYSKLFTPLENFISRLDVAISGAIAANKFNLTKPCLSPSKSRQTKGLIKAINLRHPIVEQLNTQEECVAHDISLEDKGMLIFSVNGAGKSTLLRAIGINVILAQAGMYVAADSFRFRPYHYLITRILGGDDLLKGQGTFEVEMRDLSTILKLAKYNSLILGDEICHGTEVSSGTAILAATIERLTAAQSSFVLSTHLHQVYSLTDTPVRCYHLTVIQQELGLYYERKLEPGPGPSQYGIEVMGHIIKDKNFCESALRYRNLINWDQPTQRKTSSLTEFRPSQYNSKVFMDFCEICGAPAEAIHHIQPKKSGGRGINRRSNLVPVCSGCHLDIHRDKISILGWKSTPGHKKLYWVKLNKPLDSGTE